MIRPLHRGSVLADGLWLDPERVRGAWEPGCRVFQAEDRCVLVFPRPRRVRAELAPGAPLVRRGDQWLSMPVPAGSAGTSAASGEKVPSGPGLVRARRGEVGVVPLTPFDPAVWVDGAFTVVPVVPLGPPPAPLPVLSPPEPAPKLVKPSADVIRELATDLPPDVVPPKSALVRLAELFLEKKAKHQDKAGAGGTGLAPAGGATGDAGTDGATGGGGAGLSGVGGRIAGGLRGLGAIGGGLVQLATGGLPEGPGWWHRFTDWLEGGFVSTLDRLGLGDFLQQEHARYGEELQRLFDAGRLEEALRRAIPLGGEAAPGAPASRPMVLPPYLDRLVIGPGTGGATSSASLGESAYDRLKASYRKAAQALEAQGKLDEAAYVLVELLGVPGEAVDMYLRHGAHARALQIAALRRLGEPLVATLTWMAGDPDRAVRMAWASLQFEAFHTELSKRAGPGAAEALLEARIQLCLRDGDVAAALALAPDDERASSWLDLLADGEGEAALQALVQRLSRPDPPDPTPRFARIAAAPGPEGPALRRAALAELPRIPKPVRGLIATRLVRAALADGADVRARLPEVDDPVLAWDAGLLRTPAPPPRQTAFTFVPDGRPVLDASPLPDGQVLVARGTSVDLYGPDGRFRRSWPIAADRLVPAVHGRAFLARGAASVVRVDLPGGTVTPLGEIPASVWAPTYTDGRWIVATGNQLEAIEVHPPVTVLWRRAATLTPNDRGDEHRGTIVAIAVSGRKIDVDLVDAGHRFRQAWTLGGTSMSVTSVPTAAPVAGADLVELPDGVIVELPGPISARHSTTHSLVWGPRGPVAWIDRKTGAFAVLTGR